MAAELVFGRLLLVYQMPKTGSQTVEATLQTCGLPHRIVRVHFLSRALAARVRAGLTPKSSSEWVRNVREQLRQSGQIRRLLRLRRWLRRCRVQIPKVDAISAVREPIGLGLAAIFENYLHLFNHLESATLEACKKELLRPRDHKFIQEWFELELEAMLGINVYQTAFPRERGYDIFESRYGRALVFRFEGLPKLPQMLTDFLGRPVAQMVSRNVAADKQ